MAPVSLVVEGWRTSCHSYALVNQHQLLHLAADPRLRVQHVDVPFPLARWSQIDAGFEPDAKATLAALPPPRDASADVIYRISFPMRVHGGDAARVFVFVTTELRTLDRDWLCGPDGGKEGVDIDAVDIVTPSQWSRAGLLAAGFDADRIHVVPHGVDPARFRPAPPDRRRKLRAGLNIPDDAFVFLNVSSLMWNKGGGPLLAAFAACRRRHPRALLLLKGEDALYGNMMNATMAEAVRLDPSVADPAFKAAMCYMPHTFSQADMAALYQLSDAYVSPYRAEGFNLPVLEALACGLPVLVSAGGATDDFCPDHLCLRIAATLTSGPAGTYLEPDVASLAASMDRVMTDHDFRARAAAGGPRWAASRYAWSTVARTLADLLIAGRGS
jgi:glycosyltransferase involved in cell wall biosynthesis